MVENKSLSIENINVLNSEKIIQDFFENQQPQLDVINSEMGEILNKIYGVPGDIVELGVHTGNNATQFMWHCPERRYFGFDTFSGYTEEDLSIDPNKKELKENEGRWNYDENETIERLQDLRKKLCQFARLMLNDKNITFLYEFDIIKGDLKQTLPKNIEKGNISQIALLYVDCNAYAAALKGMECAYPLMPKGAMICIDEHKNGGETKALEEMSKKYNLPIEETGFEFVANIHSNPSKYIVKK